MHVMSRLPKSYINLDSDNLTINLELKNSVSDGKLARSFFNRDSFAWPSARRGRECSRVQSSSRERSLIHGGRCATQKEEKTDQTRRDHKL